MMGHREGWPGKAAKVEGARMPIYISHSSAQSLWRSPRARDYVRRPCVEACRPANLPHSYRALFSQGILTTSELRSLPRPIDIVVAKDSDRLYGRQIRNHVWMREIPDRSFVAIDPSARLSTPEFTYLQMASVLSVPRLAAYACEITGVYSLNQVARSFHSRPPLTNLAALGAFLSKCVGSRGVRPARKALSYAVEGFRSPAETSLALLLTLPAGLGGYGLPPCHANYRIDLAESWERYLRTPYLLADLARPSEMLVMEYDSDMVHGEHSVRDHDDDRKSALEAMGYTVITIRSQRLMGPTKLDIIVRQRVAPLLGVTPPSRTGLFAQRSDDLRAQLLG